MKLPGVRDEERIAYCSRCNKLILTNLSIESVVDKRRGFFKFICKDCGRELLFASIKSSLELTVLDIEIKSGIFNIDNWNFEHIRLSDE